MMTKMSTDRRPFRRFLPVVLAFLVLSSSSLVAGDKDLRKHFALIFGTAYGPDDRPIYGVKIRVHPEGKNRPSWDLVSDHRGEFAAHVPPGPADYVISGEVEILPVEDGRVSKAKKKLKAESKVHIDAEERQDVGLHLKE
jgi:hypothetical protein